MKQVALSVIFRICCCGRILISENRFDFLSTLFILEHVNKQESKSRPSEGPSECPDYMGTKPLHKGEREMT